MSDRERYLHEPFGCVITSATTPARRVLSSPAGSERRMHWSFGGPPRATGGEEERLEVFRQVREEIRGRIESELLPVDVSSLSS